MRVDCETPCYAYDHSCCHGLMCSGVQVFCIMSATKTDVQNFCLDPSRVESYTGSESRITGELKNAARDVVSRSTLPIEGKNKSQLNWFRGNQARLGDSKQGAITSTSNSGRDKPT